MVWLLLLQQKSLLLHCQAGELLDCHPAAAAAAAAAACSGSY
jgi:hypothetical protein